MTTTHAAAGLRVLVVDDDHDTTDSMAMLLSLNGYQPRCAYDGASALAAARSWVPDVVLLDLQMPGMDGYEVARRFRQDPGLDQVFIACVSGHGQAVHRQRALEVGFDEHLLKPVKPEDLQTLLERLAQLICQVRGQTDALKSEVRRGYQLIRESRALLDQAP
jgi:CheY-like chemotaxis protein